MGKFPRGGVFKTPKPPKASKAFIDDDTPLSQYVRPKRAPRAKKFGPKNKRVVSEATKAKAKARGAKKKKDNCRDLIFGKESG